MQRNARKRTLSHEALHKYNQHTILEGGGGDLPAARVRLSCLHPLLPNTPVCLTAVAAPVPKTQTRARAKPNVPVTSSAAATRARKVTSAAYSLGGAPSKCSVGRHCSHRTMLSDNAYILSPRCPAAPPSRQPLRRFKLPWTIPPINAGWLAEVVLEGGAFAPPFALQNAAQLRPLRQPLFNGFPKFKTW